MKDVSNLEYLKKLNRINVLNIIRENKTLSRQNLAKITGLTPAAISGIVRQLVEMGFVEETGFGESNGGRRPVKLQFNPEAGYVVGAEITRKRTILGIVDLQARPVKIQEIPIDMINPREGITTLVNKIDEIIRLTGISEKKIMGAGFAFPGLWNRGSQLLKRSPNLGEQWSNIPLQDWLESSMKIPVSIENNSNAAALAEHTFGCGKDVKNLVYVNLGEGFSAGVIMNDEILYGSLGYAGEMGHVVIVENGPLCNCGNKGCLESLYAVPALVHKANNEIALYRDDDGLKRIWREQGELTSRDILSSAVVVDSYAWQLIRQAGWYIGTGIANIINFYNPEVVSLGGTLSSAGQILMEPLKESVYHHAFPEIAESTRIQLSAIGREASFYGACLGAIKQLFAVDGSENILSLSVNED